MILLHIILFFVNRLGANMKLLITEKLIKSGVISLFLCLLSSSVFAGRPAGAITFSLTASSTSIPTLSGSMLIVLSLLLFVVAFRVAKQKNANKFFMSFVGVTALSLGLGGIKFVSDAEAVIHAHTPITTSEFTNLTLIKDLYENNRFFNDTQETISISNIEVFTLFECGGTSGAGYPECKVGESIPPSNGCSLQCTQLVVSDIRLKRNIKFLTELENGIKLYSFKYNWSEETYVGVMAQDLLKDAVYKDSVALMNDNYYGVNYKALGLKMITLDQWLKTPKNILNISKI